MINNHEFTVAVFRGIDFFDVGFAAYHAFVVFLDVLVFFLQLEPP
jgi:hypothetical protein